MSKLEIKDGQTYICTKSDRPWWTEGKEYKAVLDDINEAVLVDDEEDQWSSTDLKGPNSHFKLKEEIVTYTLLEVKTIIVKAYHMYDNDAQRLAYIKGYFAK